MGAITERDRSRGAAHLLHDDTMLREPHPRAPEPLLSRHPQQAHPPALLEERAQIWPIVLSVYLIRVGRQMLGAEPAHRFSQLSLRLS